MLRRAELGLLLLSDTLFVCRVCCRAGMPVVDDVVDPLCDDVDNVFVEWPPPFCCSVLIIVDGADRALIFEP